jgi:hypothetical protein
MDDSVEEKFEQLKDYWVSEKKKVITAVCLILLMAFMWGRILSGGGPEKAQGSTETGQEQAKEKIKIEFVPLEKIEGRNDTILRDYFSIDDNIFSRKNEREIAAKDSADKTIEQISNKLRLEAIEYGDKSRVFINGDLYCDGETIKIEIGEKFYELKVVDISINKVVLKCSKGEITLKLYSRQK